MLLPACCIADGTSLCFVVIPFAHVVHLTLLPPCAICVNSRDASEVASWKRVLMTVALGGASPQRSRIIKLFSVRCPPLPPAPTRALRRGERRGDWLCFTLYQAVLKRVVEQERHHAHKSRH